MNRWGLRHERFRIKPDFVGDLIFPRLFGFTFAKEYTDSTTVVTEACANNSGCSPNINKITRRNSHLGYFAKSRNIGKLEKKKREGV